MNESELFSVLGYIAPFYFIYLFFFPSFFLHECPRLMLGYEHLGFISINDCSVPATLILIWMQYCSRLCRWLCCFERIENSAAQHWQSYSEYCSGDARSESFCTIGRKETRDFVGVGVMRPSCSSKFMGRFKLWLWWTILGEFGWSK